MIVILVSSKTDVMLAIVKPAWRQWIKLVLGLSMKQQ